MLQVSIRIRWLLIPNISENTKSNHNKISKLHLRLANFVFLALFLSYIISSQEVQGDSSGAITPPIQSFSNFTCTAGIGNVLLTGQFTNGDTPYRVIFLKMLVLDQNGHTIATGSGNISNIKAHDTVAFNAITRFSGNFSSCTVQIDNAIPK
ncbi:exported protein of unknown function [Nitrosotalea devaniterrae]|uniref:Uncharacterized protein n=1 Tax=Nitrosotalea devaniterrae TaxID=1078905 RepID=A0A128A4K0_9ARCH|nr:exported protein of unknown function [Candidatus Nitrosotalea devanaterra]